jgi:alpha-tubulin suppressor-like RCC1 family protein
MFSWGSHKAGQLGTGSKPNDGSSTPQKVAPLGDGSPVMRVAAGAEFSMAVNSAGQVGAWGEIHSLSFSLIDCIVVLEKNRLYQASGSSQATRCTDNWAMAPTASS